MSYTFQPVEDQDLDKVIDLWALAFKIAGIDTIAGDPEHRVRSLRYAKETLTHLIGAYHDDEPVAVAGIIDFDVKLGDRWLKAGGIAAVATSPPHRRRNLVKRLLTECNQWLHERRVPLSVLWPFSYPFYERMGYAITDMPYKVTIDLNHLPAARGEAGRYKDIKLSDFEKVMPLHDKWMDRHNLGVRRSRHRWDMFLTDRRYLRRLYIHNDGYILFNVPDAKDKDLEIVEWCHLSERAFLDGLELLRHMNSQFTTASWLTPELQSLLEFAGMSAQPAINVVPGMMSRV